METLLRKLEIGGGVSLSDEYVYLGGLSVGQITDLSIHWRDSRIAGRVSVLPSDSISFVKFAAALATVDIAAEYHIPGEFWPNSFKKNGEWYAEYWDGTHVKTEKI